MEQKNWSVVRGLIGYDRYESTAALAQMRRVYELVRVEVNGYLPVMKLVGKERQGAKVRKKYDVPRTPYRRALAAGVLAEEPRAAFEALTAQFIAPLGRVDGAGNAGTDGDGPNKGRRQGEADAIGSVPRFPGREFSKVPFQVSTGHNTMMGQAFACPIIVPSDLGCSIVNDPSCINSYGTIAKLVMLNTAWSVPTAATPLA